MSLIIKGTTSPQDASRTRRVQPSAISPPGDMIWGLFPAPAMQTGRRGLYIAAQPSIIYQAPVAQSSTATGNSSMYSSKCNPSTASTTATTVGQRLQSIKYPERVANYPLIWESNTESTLSYSNAAGKSPSSSSTC